MRQSLTFIPTQKQIPADAKIVSHQILLQGGYVKQTAAGIYSYLPLGYKVLRNIEDIVREELTEIGGLEMLMPVLQPLELWQESGRATEYGPLLMQMKDRHDRPFVLGPTHEEVITDIMREFVKSYKQLPLLVYQIQTKFRDEYRPRFGLMRGREFSMLDAYSFSATNDDLDNIYDKMITAYRNIFTRLAFDFRMVSALSGEIGGSESAEFMVLSHVGEDTIVYSDTSDFVSNLEVYPDIKEGDVSPDGQGNIKFAKGIEVGHIFKLGTKYSEALDASVANEHGELVPIIMGCYGIGVSRLIMAAIEQHQEDGKVIWPIEIAPYKVHILIANQKNEGQVMAATAIYDELKDLGIDVLLDDRSERLGAKFADADLIGAPLRIVVGKGIEAGKVELIDRRQPDVVNTVNIDEASKLIKENL